MNEEPTSPKIVVRDRRAFRKDGTRRQGSEDSPPAAESPRPATSPEVSSEPDGAAASAAAEPAPDARLQQLVSLLFSQAAAMLESRSGAETKSAAPSKEALSGLRMVIGLLEMLDEKTRGRLAPEDARFVADALFRLRMSYLNATRKAEA